MNILQINKFNYLKGGSEKHLFELEKLLVEKGHKVLDFSMKDEKNRKSEYEKYFIEPIDLHKFSFVNIFKYFYNYDAVRQLKKMLKNEKVDVAHLHNIIGQISPAIIRVLKKNKIKIVMTLHDYRLICPNAKLFTASSVCYACQNKNYWHCVKNKCVHNSYAKSFLAMLETYVNRRILNYYQDVDVFIAPSEYMKNISVKFGLPEEKIKVLYNFLNDFALKNEESVSFSDKNDYLLFFGRISEEKGLEILLDTMKNIDYKLKIAGVGPDYEKIEKIIKDKDLINKVELLGFLQEKELQGYIKNAKAIVIPSIWPENMSYSLIEAMILGKLVIASDIGGISEVISNAKNGFVFRAGNSADLKFILKRLDKVNIDLISNNAKEIAKDIFSKERYYKDVMDIYTIRY